MAVDVRAKAHAAIVDLAQAAQAEHLKAAAVGQDGALMAAECVQTTELGDDLDAGALRQMVGVVENDVRPQVGDIDAVQRLDARQGAHRHENGGVETAVVCVQAPQAGGALWRDGAALEVDGTHQSTNMASPSE